MDPELRGAQKPHSSLCLLEKRGIDVLKPKDQHKILGRNYRSLKLKLK